MGTATLGFGSESSRESKPEDEKVRIGFDHNFGEIAKTYQLRRVFRPSQIAHLRPGVDRLHRLARKCVPEADAAIGCAATGREKPCLVKM